MPGGPRLTISLTNKLSPEAMRAFQRDGVVCHRQVLVTAWVERLRTAVQKPLDSDMFSRAWVAA